jgi:23S rRNA pseudouridine2605 synthase
MRKSIPNPKPNKEQELPLRPFEKYRKDKQAESSDKQPKRKRPAPKYRDADKAGETEKKTATPIPAKRPIEKDKYQQERAYFKSETRTPAPEKEALMPLNKYVAHCGICSRRDAAEWVKEGRVTINGMPVNDPAYRVQPQDKITLDGKPITPQRNLTYILLNKPKGFLTTTEDPEGRRTVMDLVASAAADRLYPIGRLDRMTTGLLLLTNDGALAQKLSHPKYEVRKVYKVTIDRALEMKDFHLIKTGLELEDGPVKVDEIAFLEAKNELGLEIHSGRNRIVRRIFEALGYVVEKLDRVMYAGLTKKNLPRGKWRFLTEQEIIFLKHFKA